MILFKIIWRYLIIWRLFESNFLRLNYTKLLRSKFQRHLICWSKFSHKITYPLNWKLQFAHFRRQRFHHQIFPIPMIKYWFNIFIITLHTKLLQYKFVTKLCRKWQCVTTFLRNRAFRWLYLNFWFTIFFGYGVFIGTYVLGIGFF